MVVITDAATEKLKSLMERDHMNAVRLSIIKTNCMGGKGHSYRMGYESMRKEGDDVSENNGITVYVDSESSPLLKGAQLDFVVTLNSHGFKVNNPNAKSKCHCGKHDIFE
ncbi:MAG: iron-sulfur cluster assembly accessory protein [Candidatus Aenigmarchaeota archaeon]|nr:iron-sulfur cluster assembly accessory protein [Candidatus Aenigmarchaeota archaeon]